MAEITAKLVIKKTGTALSVPALEFVEAGELALNYTDGKLYFRDNLDTIQVIGIKNPASLSLPQTFEGANIFNSLASFSSVALSPVELTDGTLSWNGNDGNLATVTLTQNSTLFDIENVSPGSYVLRVIQDSIGSRLLEFGSKFKSSNGEIFEVSSAPNSISILTILNNGDNDLYLVGQVNFVSFGTAAQPLGMGEIPQQLTLTGVTGGGEWLNTTFDRIPDVNGETAWEVYNLTASPYLLATITSDGAENYVLETFSKNNLVDAWVSTGVQFETSGPGGAWVSPWVLSGTADYTGSMNVSATGSTPSYVITDATNGHVINLYLVPVSSYLWYGTDPIPTGFLFRGVNPYPSNTNNHAIFLAPRNNDVNGNWVIGLANTPEDNNLLFELMYNETTGPIGTFADAGVSPIPVEVTAF